MKKLIAYFQELLITLKRIERHLEKSEKYLETLSSTVSTSTYGRGYPSLRTGKNQYDA